VLGSWISCCFVEVVYQDSFHQLSELKGAPLGFELPAQLQTAAQQRQMASASGRQQKAPHQKSRLWNMNSFSFMGIWKHAEHTTQSEGHV
jgi:hypothetical protein